MNKSITLLPVALVMVMGLFAAFTTPAFADGKTASAPATTKTTTSYVSRQETVCDTGACGQQNCHVVVTQVPVHTTVNTAVDPRILVMITGLAAVSAAVLFTTVKSRA